ncbi:hypothetical protein BDV3_002873 [Batrachochytrium dendrobatidis]
MESMSIEAPMCIPHTAKVYRIKDSSLTDSTDADKSSVRRKLSNQYKSTKRGTLTDSFLLMSSVALLRATLDCFKGNLSQAKIVASGRKTTTPVPIKTKISKLRIPLCEELALPGMLDKDVRGSIKAEWVDAHPVTVTTPVERVILYIHGGAYLFASRRTHRSVTWRLAKSANARVLSIDYRLAPEFTFPTPIFDTLCAYKFLIDPPAMSNQPRYLPNQISFCGDSAGGGLAIATMLYCRDTGKFPVPGAIGCFSPWLDLTQSFPAWHLNEPFDYLPASSTDPLHVSKQRPHPYIKCRDELLDPYVSPVLAIEDPSKPIPPMLIQVGDAERVRDDGIVFSQLSFAKSPIQLEIYEDQVHVFQMFAPFHAIARLALERMSAFLSQQTGTSTKLPAVHRSSIWVRKSTEFVAEDIPDPIGIIEDGMVRLFDTGIWNSDMDTTSLSALENTIDSK